MPRTRLTAIQVERIKPPKVGRVEYRDALVPGLELRVTDKGRKTWSIVYRVARQGAPNPAGLSLKGKLRRMTLGTYPLLDLAKARETARAALRQSEEGIDPQLERRRKSIVGGIGSNNTVAGLVSEFIRLHAKPNTRKWRETERSFARHVLPRWGDWPIDGISRGDVISLLDEIVADGWPYAAADVLKHLRRMFNWALEREFVEYSPCSHVTPPVKASARDRVLNEDEIVAVWRAADALSYPFGSLIQLLLLTGQRRNEIANMRWGWFRPDGNEWQLEIPPDYYKSGRPQVVPLSPMTVQLIRGLPRFNSGDFVLSTTGGRRPISGFAKAKRCLDEASSVEGWRLHDLRRTASTELARLQVDPFVIDRVLGHAIPGVRGRYNRYGYLREKRDALESWAERLQILLTDKDDDWSIPDSLVNMQLVAR